MTGLRADAEKRNLFMKDRPSLVLLYQRQHVIDYYISNPIKAYIRPNAASRTLIQLFKGDSEHSSTKAIEELATGQHERAHLPQEILRSLTQRARADCDCRQSTLWPSHNAIRDFRNGNQLVRYGFDLPRHAQTL